MCAAGIQDILPVIERPSRYLGSEINRIKKDPAAVKLNIALAFPDLYEIGTSHFGLQILYHLLNGHPEILAERVYAPAEDMEAALRRGRRPLMSMETRRGLKAFDILGFSLLYELNYTNVLGMLSLSGIPFYASERDRGFPLVIAGGPCTCNPEPVAEFFDAMVIGDGEAVIMEMAGICLKMKRGGGLNKSDVLNAWSGLKGVYVPAFYSAKRDDRGFQTTVPLERSTGVTPLTVQRAILPRLDDAPFPEAPVVPYGKPVHDRLRLEISRGCTRGCRFCQAGMIYRPVRERYRKSLLSITEKSIRNTGYEDLSLLSLSTGDHTQIRPLIDQLVCRYETEHVAVSLPSLRAGTLTPELMKLIRRVRKTGFTIAPEAGSQRLRNVINKNIDEQEILDTVSSAFAMGWRVIKLYFMIGLPTERASDLEDIVALVKALRNVKASKGRRGRLNVSIATFIPKPHTPFQWAAQLGLEASRDRIAWLKSRLTLPGVQFKWQNPEMSFLEGLWARGDRGFSRLLVQAYHRGCRFDGWSDRFRFPLWQKAVAETDIDTGFYANRPRDLNEPLPWDHVDIGVTKDFLKKEWQRALKEERTGDCRWDACQQCGVCDFKEILPDLSTENPEVKADEALPPPGAPLPEQVLCLTYSKTGDARFLGHLEMVNLFLRAFRRIPLPLKYSQGFHPMPKVSFEDPLPIGIESLEERLYATVTAEVDPASLPGRLNEKLPEGLRVTGCRPVSCKEPENSENAIRYVIRLAKGSFEKEKLERFRRAPVFTVTRTNKKGRVNSLDLKEIVFKLDLAGPRGLHLEIRHSRGRVVRPLEILTAVFGLSEEQVKLASIIKGRHDVQTDYH